jgi:hypothetical protein
MRAISEAYLESKEYDDASISRLNTLVYEAYGLTADERAIIEREIRSLAERRAAAGDDTNDDDDED